MSKFDHPNILTLNGVCLDGGPTPFIIMPKWQSIGLPQEEQDNTGH